MADRRPRLKHQQIENIRVAYMRGIPYTEIAAQFSCHIATVQRLAKKFAWAKAFKSDVPVFNRIEKALSLKPNDSPTATAWIADMLADCQESLLGLRAASVLTVDEWHRRQQALKLTDDMARRALGLDNDRNVSIRFNLTGVSALQAAPVKQVADATPAEPAKPTDVVEIDVEKPNPS